jgi:hypothetical protein
MKIRPMWAVMLSTASSAANAITWLDHVKGWAAAATVIIGVPTAVLMLVYWILKVRHELNRKD